MQADELIQAAQALRDADHVIALTGAGMSVESGIPDFRSPGGIWETYPPDEFATIDAFLRDPDKVWSMWYELGRTLLDVAPNPGHAALATLESMGRLDAIITQNIDNLHQIAGSTKVIDYHGNAKRLCCMSCHQRTPLDATRRTAGAPRCACGGVQKPDVVLFGELIPAEAMRESEALAQSCDVMLVVGTSAQVYPAAGLPAIAKRNGATVIECNVEPTEFTAELTDHYLQGPCGTTLPQLLQRLSDEPLSCFS